MSETIATLLAKHELSLYTAAFDDHGWDSLRALQDVSDDDLEQLCHGRGDEERPCRTSADRAGQVPAAATAAPAENVPAVSAVLAAPAAAGQSDQGGEGAR